MSLSPQARSLIEAPLRIEQGAQRLGEGLWLYLWLVAHANCRGYVCKEIGSLSQGAGEPEDVILDRLSRLAEAGLISLEHPAPYLVIRLRFWRSDLAPSGEPSTANLLSAAADAVQLQDEVPVSKQQQAAAASKQTGDGVSGEGDPLAICRLLDVSDEDVTETVELIGRHPPALVAKALERVRATPQSQIKKSRLALFHYLLVHLK